MNTAQAIARAGGARELAKMLQVTTQAVYKWPERMPPLRLYQLKELRPEWFDKRHGRKAKP
jgi:hypothetical protein